jgi:predicted transposase YbfD/YdcC
MTAEVPPLIEILAEIPDARQPSGKRYPLGAMLNAAVVALLCGYKSILAISEWGVNYRLKYLKALGFNEHGYPGQACWYRVLGEVNVELLEVVLRIWVQAVLVALDETQAGLSIDGKTLRTSQKMGASDCHLLGAALHDLGVILGQLPIWDKTNEIGMMQAFLLTLTLQGRIVTTDALLTQEAIAQTIVQQGGDYVLPVKDNHPTLRANLETWFEFASPELTDHAVSKGHGRITRYQIETTSRPAAWMGWPNLHQVFKLTRTTIDPRTGEFFCSTVYGITSLSPDRASPSQLLTFIRHHWTIENKLHWIRDVIFDEDRSQLRKGHLHHLMSLLRNLSLSLLRFSAHTSIAAALRFFSARPSEAIGLLAASFGE